jgi:Fe-S-cluster containining protein
VRDRSLIPALRGGLDLQEKDGGWILEDGTRRIRLPLDALGAEICSALLEGPTTPNKLMARVGSGRMELYERVALLNRHAMIATTRATNSVARHAQAAALEPLDGSLRHDAGLRHTCQGCGGCCTATELGPLSADDVARILAVDWSPHLPESVTPEDWLQEVEMQGGRMVTLLGRRDDRCVFLRSDNKCTIHAVAGAAQKPLMCRQFPHFFVQVPESPAIHVSLATECRAWHLARVEGATIEEATPELKTLLEERGSALVLRAPIEVWDGLDWSWKTWSAVREEQLDRLRIASDFPSLIDGITEPVLAALGASMDPHEEEEFFATRAGWGIPAPPALTAGGALAEFKRSSATVDGVLTAGLIELADRYEESGELGMARRHRALGDSLAHLMSGQTTPPAECPPEALEIWREMALAAVDSHEIARADTILHGAATLVLKMVLARHDCRLGVSDGLRARVEAHDVVDRMVRVTKMLRGALVSALMRQVARDLVALFLFNASVFAHRRAPRALGLDGSTRLPGALR